MDQFKDDLEVLEIDRARSDDVTIREVKKAYRKKAFRVHPDTSGYESTADFQVLSNAFERALNYLVAKHNTDKPHDDDGANDPENTDDDEDKFVRDNFDRFNFPRKNSDSFTVIVENDLADAWQDCFALLFGKPIVNKNQNSGTEAGRVWKVDCVHEENKAVLTIHFYNKPVKSKKSKFLVQGGNHAFKCLFVFDEMPKIYKMVCKLKPKVSMAPDSFTTPIRYQKKRRLNTSIKKRNIRHKPAQKPHEIVCGFCDYTLISNVKMIRHMKASHTQTNLMDITPRILSEDLSVLSDEDNKTNETEKLLTETERCENYIP